jgi:hypothetical protein
LFKDSNFEKGQNCFSWFSQQFYNRIIKGFQMGTLKGRKTCTVRRDSSKDIKSGKM